MPFTRSSSKSVPRLSIVISTLNAGKTLSQCLDSIAAQTFDDFEVVIIDGGSCDDTAQIAARYGPLVSHFQSEKDSGIYDAWNKALKVVRGEWVSFLGADDMFASPTALTSFADQAIFPRVTLVSARVDMIDAKGLIMRASGQEWNAAKMKEFMCVAHPGAWHHRCLFDEHGAFSVNYRLAGDYEFLLRAASGVRAAFIPESLVVMRLGGVSNRSYWRHVAENFAVLREQAGCGYYYAVRFFVRASIGRVMRKLKSALSGGN